MVRLGAFDNHNTGVLISREGRGGEGRGGRGERRRGEERGGEGGEGRGGRGGGREGRDQSVDLITQEARLSE